MTFIVRGSGLNPASELHGWWHPTTRWERSEGTPENSTIVAVPSVPNRTSRVLHGEAPGT